MHSVWDNALLPLQVVILIFAIIELGLSAYVVASATTNTTISEYDPNWCGQGCGGYDHYNVSTHGSPPGAVSFLLFASIWTTLRTFVMIIRPLLRARNNSYQGGKSATLASIATLMVNAISMIFWLAGFAAFAYLFNGAAPQGIAGALLAFAVLLWLLFLAVLSFNICTACSIVVSQRPEYSALKDKNRSAQNEGGSTRDAEAQKHSAHADVLEVNE